MGELYEYLNEGGTWIVYEHVVVFPWQGWFLKWWQGTSHSIRSLIYGCGVFVCLDARKILQDVSES